jgi:hypothetical protein
MNKGFSIGGRRDCRDFRLLCQTTIRSLIAEFRGSSKFSSCQNVRSGCSNIAFIVGVDAGRYFFFFLIALFSGVALFEFMDLPRRRGVSSKLFGVIAGPLSTDRSSTNATGRLFSWFETRGIRSFFNCNFVMVLVFTAGSIADRALSERLKMVTQNRNRCLCHLFL